MKYKKAKFFFLLFFITIFATPAQAVCPVCVVAVAGGLEISRWLGVDDSITGLWFGGFLVALTAWTVSWLDKKKINFAYRLPIIALAYYGLTIIPLYWKNIIGIPYNKILGIDKILFGILLGSAIFIGGVKIHSVLKARNNNKSYFPFQRVVIPFLCLTLMTGALYLITN